MNDVLSRVQQQCHKYFFEKISGYSDLASAQDIMVRWSDSFPKVYLFILLFFAYIVILLFQIIGGDYGLRNEQRLQ